MTLWTTQEINAALSLKITHSFEITGVSLDTRTLKQGDCFVALRGEQTDGHDYIHAALDAGAGAVLSQIPYDDARVICVSDTFEALNTLARYRRFQLDNAFIIGVTGSVGKTTTKELLRLMLSQQGLTSATEGNYNNHLGVPVTLMRTPKNASFVVVEMGMNHAGELNVLSHLVRPHLAMVTTVAPSHIGHFASLHDIAMAKAEIFAGLMAGGSALYGDDHAYTHVLHQAAEAAGARRIVSLPVQELAQKDVFSWGEATFDLAVYSDDPALKKCMACALAVVFEAGASVDQAYQMLPQFERPHGRGNILDVEGNMRIIHDAYNASPASMQAALQRLVMLPCQGRRIAVLGDMLEMGKNAQAYHTALIDYIVGQPIDVVHTVGPNMATLYAKLPKHQRGLCVSSVLELDPALKKSLKPKDLVLIKGSAGIKLAQVVKQLTQS